MIAMNAYYNVNGQNIELDQEKTYNKFVANTMGFYKACFTFDSTWNEFDTKQVVFKNNKTVRGILSNVDASQYEIDIPKEVLEEEGKLSVSVIGYYANDNTKRYTTICEDSLIINPTCNSDAQASVEPELSEIEKIWVEIDNLKKEYGSNETLGAAEADLFINKLIGGDAI